MKKQLLATSALVGALIGGTMLAAPASATPLSCSGFDSYNNFVTYGVDSCVVPAGMTQMQVIATGAGGGGGGGASINSTGGHGAVVTTVIDVTPGETISVEIGQGGNAGGTNASWVRGGTGGGWTAVKRGSTLLVVAGGGGGGGASLSNTSLTSISYAGGNGGNNGTDGLPLGLFGSAVGSGASGTQVVTTNGGIGCGYPSNFNCYGVNGSIGAGGSGGEALQVGRGGGSGGGTTWHAGSNGTSTTQASGAGGGAGYIGGGGGGSNGYGGSEAGSGGGGSSFVLLGTNTTYSVATNGGANHVSGDYGRLRLSVYTPPAPSGPSTLTLAPGFVVGDLAPNAPVTLSGSDLQPSSIWSADIHSTVVQFANGVTDSSGNFSLGSNLPSSVDPGRHVITLYGIANDGSQWTRVLYITVGANLRVTYMSTTGEELASTGANVLPVISIAASLVAVGAILLVVRSRRRPTENS